MNLHTPAELKARIGQQIGLSDWTEVTQEMVNRFADLTDDHQFIHVDPRRAAQAGLASTIAHGFLVLSLLAKFGRSADFALQGVVMGMNYGFDKVRMMAPVPTGSRIRGRFVLNDLVERAPGQWLATLAVTVEIEQVAKPAIAAEWLALQIVK